MDLQAVGYEKVTDENYNYEKATYNCKHYQ